MSSTAWVEVAELDDEELVESEAEAVLLVLDVDVLSLDEVTEESRDARASSSVFKLASNEDALVLDAEDAVDDVELAEAASVSEASTAASVESELDEEDEELSVGGGPLGPCP